MPSARSRGLSLGHRPGECGLRVPERVLWLAAGGGSEGFHGRQPLVLRVFAGPQVWFENYERAHARGKGVLLFAGHFGGWELSSFVLSMHGHWMHVLMRGMDNRYLGELILRYRTMHGNKAVDKDDFVRGLLSAMKAGEVVGMLMDTNMTPPQGIFVDFFGIPACTAAGPARIALRTDAAVVPTFTIWDAALGKYRLRFDPALELVRTGDLEADIKANTQKFTSVIEEYVRKYPEQWLWVHRRWKTRPPGEKGLY